MVPLDVADVVLVQQRQYLSLDVRVRARNAEVEHLLRARLDRPPRARRHDPLGVRAGDVGVGVDHLGFEPEPELHAVLADAVHERVQPVGPDVRGDDPVTQAGAIVAARAEPAVVEDEPLDTDLRRAVGQREQPLAVVVEVHGLPHVERHRPFRRDRARPRPHVRVEAAGDRVEPVAERAVEPRAGVALAGGEPDLAGEQQLAAAEQALAGGRALGVVDVVAAERRVHGVDASRPRNRSPPARRAGRRRCRRRCGPLRFSRRCTPVRNGVRCGTRSRLCRPAKSSSSSASAGTGSASASPSTRVRLLGQVRHRGPGPHEPGGEQLDGQVEPQEPVGVDREELDAPGARRDDPVGGRAVQQHRRDAERRRPGPAGPRSGQARPSRPAGVVLGEDGDVRSDVGIVRSDHRYGGIGERHGLVGIHRRERGAPVHDHGQPAVRGVQDEAHPGGGQGDEDVGGRIAVRHAGSPPGRRSCAKCLAA